MHFVVHGADLLLHDSVGVLFILKHHLHQVELALHQAASAQRRVNVHQVTGSASFTLRLPSCLDVEELGRAFGEAGAIIRGIPMELVAVLT